VMVAADRSAVLAWHVGLGHITLRHITLRPIALGHSLCAQAAPHPASAHASAHASG
jgi:hypothetical protein